MPGNTRFKVDNGLIVNGEAGVNAEFFVDVDAHSNVNITGAGAVVGNTTTANLNAGAGVLYVNIVGGNVGINNTAPDATFKVTGTANLNGNVYVTADLFFISGNLHIGGNLVYSNTTTSGLFANPDQSPLGNTISRFNGFFYDVIIYNTLLPSANGIALGNTTKRWTLWANQATFSGDLSVGSTGLYVNTSTKQVSINATVTTSDALYIQGTSNLQGNVIVGGIITANIIATNVATFSSNSISLTTNGQSIVDSFPMAETQSVKYIVFAKSNTFVESLEILLIHDNSATVIQTTYADVFNIKVGAMDAAINGANVELYFTPNSSFGATPTVPVVVKTQKIHF